MQILVTLPLGLYFVFVVFQFPRLSLFYKELLPPKLGFSEQIAVLGTLCPCPHLYTTRHLESFFADQHRLNCANEIYSYLGVSTHMDGSV